MLQKSRGRRLALGLVIGSVLLLLCVCGMIGAAAIFPSAKTPMAPEEMVITPTPVPPTATITPRPATATKAPTGTRPPTATITSRPVTATKAPTGTRPPTATSGPTWTPRPTRPSATPVMSKGLGLTLAEWELAHKRTGGEAGFYDYDGGASSVAPLEYGVCHLERNYRPLQISLAGARGDLNTFMPVDGQLVRTYSPPNLPELIVDLYHSAWLEARMPDAAWIEGEPGQFIAIYGVFNGKVPRAVLACGNKP